MHKVIVWDLPKGIVREGTSDLKRVEEVYVRVNGELIYLANVMLDTKENRDSIDFSVKEYKRLSNLIGQIPHDLWKLSREQMEKLK